MAPLSRPAILSLAALTLHYSVLSIVLHVSRTTPGRRYHASSAIFLTELGKILVSLALVLVTGELRPAVRERRHLRALWTLRDDEEREREAEERRQVKIREEEEREGYLSSVASRTSGDEEEKEALMAKSEPRRGSVGGREDGRNEATVVSMHRRAPSLEARTPSPTRGRHPPSSLSISVALANAQTPSTPSLALIPATPAPEPSPTRHPDEHSLYPHRRASARLAEPAPSLIGDVSDWEWWLTLKATVFGQGVWKLAVLAALFCFQGNAQYVASGNLSVPLFQLAYQLKIPATAMCSVILLNRALTRQQWVSLFVLTFGVGLVQLFSVTSHGNSPSGPPPAAGVDATGKTLDGGAFGVHAEAAPSQALGLAAVMAACMSSGFASTYFERILKVAPSPSGAPSHSPSPSLSTSAILSPTLPSSQQPLLSDHQAAESPTLPLPSSIVPTGKPSLWIRNIQLSLFGLVVGLPVVLWELRGCLGALDYEYLDQGWWSRAEYVTRSAIGGFFDGFDRPLPWIVVVLQLTGGLLSALVMQHADNLLKCFSTSLSILLSVAASVVLFSFHVTPGICFGALLVLGATFAYTSPSAAAAWRWRPVTAIGTR
ncbi:hypothetical protein JCM9279_005188 [Rhodotorula babjevae]